MPRFKGPHYLTTAHTLNSYAATRHVPWQTLFKFRGFTVQPEFLTAGKYLKCSII